MFQPCADTAVERKSNNWKVGFWETSLSTIDDRIRIFDFLVSVGKTVLWHHLATVTVLIPCTRLTSPLYPELIPLWHKSSPSECVNKNKRSHRRSSAFLHFSVFCTSSFVFHSFIFAFKWACYIETQYFYDQVDNGCDPK